MPAVRLMTTSTSAERMRSTTSRYRADVARALAGGGIAHVAVHDRGARSRGLDRRLGNLLGRHGIAGCRPTVSPAPVTAQVMKTSQFMPLVPSMPARDFAEFESTVAASRLGVLARSSRV